jgi:quercetin dioxygenase-like cupin family protein
MIHKTIPEQAQKVPAAVDGRIMHSDKRAEVILLNLMPGDEIPLHNNPFDVVFAGIEGKAMLITPDTEMGIEPGETIFVTSQEERAWKNTGKTIAKIMVFKILR